MRRWPLAVVRRDWLLLKDSPWSAVLTLASTVLGVLVFGLLGRFVGQGTGYVAYVLTGITFLRVVDAVVQTPGQGVREELSRGSLEVLVDAPQPTWALMAVGGIVPAARALIEGTIALVLSAVLFHPHLAPGWRGLVAVPAAVLAVLLLALGFGILLAGAGLQSRAATAASSFFALAIAATAGVYYPVASLPGWMREISRLSPFTTALKGVRQALTHAGGLPKSLAITTGSAVVLGVLGAALMTRAVRLARSSGAFVRGG